MEIRQSSIGFLRCMGNIAWSALRHPFKTTLIDSRSGKVIGHFNGEELQKYLEENRKQERKIR